MSEELENWIINIKDRNYSKSTISSLMEVMPPNLYKEIPSGGQGHAGKVNFIAIWISENQFENKITYNKNEKKKINVLVADDTNASSEIQFLERGFDVTVLKMSDYKKKFDRADVNLVLFTGGEDVSTEYYDEPKGKYTHSNIKRDEKEQQTYREFRGKAAMFGICRGAQFLTVMNGGKLIQHVEGHGQSHTIMVEKKGVFEMTSVHHQMMYPYTLTPNSYELIAYSEYFRSNTYLDGENKENDLPKDFVEPEIVFYKGNKSLCIQGHPEYSSCPEKTKDLCIQLIYDYLFSEKEMVQKRFMPEEDGILPTFIHSDNYYHKEPIVAPRYIYNEKGKITGIIK